MHFIVVKPFRAGLKTGISNIIQGYVKLKKNHDERLYDLAKQGKVTIIVEQFLP